MSISNENNSSPYYVVIDLGSNSFHMLITQQLKGSVQIVDKIKRKVRLAAGLNDDNLLSEQAMLRGLTCLSYFAERLRNIPDDQIKIVATAAVRLAKNSADFLQRANAVLGKKVSLLSGKQEAKLIYLGVAYTNNDTNQRFVIDIGGASTELIIGLHLKTRKIVSLDIGCVTLNNRYFCDGIITEKTFYNAKLYASKLLQPLVEEYSSLGWHNTLGGSGTMQALAEILIFNSKTAIISRSFLREIEQQLLMFSNIEHIKIPGLKDQRIPVFLSGVAILTAIFDCFNIEELQLSNGALREGLLYQMLPPQKKLPINQQTIKSLMQRYHVDKQNANNVKEQAIYLFDCFSQAWDLKKDNTYELLLASADLHEIGLLLAYKNYQQHSAYIIEHADLIGFNQTERQLLKALILFHTSEVLPERLKHSFANHQLFTRLLVILRLAVILCRQRNNSHLPSYTAYIDQEIYLQMPNNWLHSNTLIHDELTQETQYLETIGYRLIIS
jgi:exopolyphosphatase/guanosine-5'-triphosphate,3'-diphosphate pyrophosphatase